MRSNSSLCRLDSSFNSLLKAFFLSFRSKLTESFLCVTEAALLRGVNDQLLHFLLPSSFTFSVPAFLPWYFRHSFLLQWLTIFIFIQKHTSSSSLLSQDALQGPVLSPLMFTNHMLLHETLVQGVHISDHEFYKVFIYPWTWVLIYTQVHIYI